MLKSEATGLIILNINSWTEGSIATNMGGEPAMTVIPNLLVTGTLTIIVSMAVVVWAAFVRDKNGGRNLLLLTIFTGLAYKAQKSEHSEVT
jgi:hypothetical protein